MRFSVYSIGLILVAATTLLANKPLKQSASTGTCTHKTPLKPGVPGSPGHLIKLPQRGDGVTELAALMREMYDAMKAQKTAFEKKQAIKPLPDFSRVNCTWPTDPATRGPTFDAFSASTAAALEAHGKAPTRDTYNRVVTTCVACHQAMCPGPVAALNGLFFGDDGTEAKTSCGE